MKVALFIVAIIACASATSLFTQFPMDFSKRRSILAVLTQVETQLKMGGPLDAITKALDDFATAIDEEQATHDALKEKQDVECEDEFKLREQAVAEAEGALKEAQETLDGCKAQKTRAEGDLAITKKQLAENKQFLINAQNTRNKEHYAFETLQGKHEQVVAAIDAAIQYINDFAAAEQKGQSFVQLTKHANKILVMAVQLQTVHHMGPALSALSQLGSMEENDDAFIEELKNIFRKFRQNSVEEFEARQQAEAESQKAFDEEKARLESIIEHLTAQQANLEQEISELNKCVMVQQGIVADATAKRNRNAKLLEDAKAVCAAFQKEYDQATAARTEEKSLLAAIRAKVEERFAQLEGKESVQTRGRQDKEDWTYENQSEHQDVKFERADEVVL